MLCLLLFFTTFIFTNTIFAQYPPQYGTPFTGVPDPRDVTIYQVNMHNSSGAIEQLDSYTDVAALNFANDTMRIAMITAMKSWVYRANVDGFRCNLLPIIQGSSQVIAFRNSSAAIRRGTLVSYDNNDVCFSCQSIIQSLRKTPVACPTTGTGN